MAAALTVSAFDQNGNDCWCNSDADGCWVTGENGEQVYLMFWTEASRELFMGKDSKAPLGLPTPPGKFNLDKPGAKCITFDEALNELEKCVESGKDCKNLAFSLALRPCPEDIKRAMEMN